MILVTLVMLPLMATIGNRLLNSIDELNSKMSSVLINQTQIGDDIRYLQAASTDHEKRIRILESARNNAR